MQMTSALLEWKVVEKCGLRHMWFHSLHLPANTGQVHLKCYRAQATPPTNHHHCLAKLGLAAPPERAWHRWRRPIQHQSCRTTYHKTDGSLEQAKLVAPGCDHCRHNCADHSRIPCTPDCVVAVDPGAGRRRCHPRRPWKSLSSPGSDRRPPTPLRAPLRAPGSGRDDARSGGNIRRREGGSHVDEPPPGGGGRMSHPPRSAREEGEGHGATFPTGPDGPLRRRRGRRERDGGAVAANPSCPRRPAREGRGSFFLKKIRRYQG
jgi:hypothetical protein